MNTDNAVREADTLAGVLVQLVTHLPPVLTNSMFTWVDRICRELPLQQVAIAKTFVQLLLRAAQGNDLDVVCSHAVIPLIVWQCLALAKDVHIELKDIADNETLDRGVYSLVNPSTGASILSVTLGFLDLCMDELEWVMSVLATQAATEAALAESKEHQHSNERASLESAMVARIILLVSVFVELSQSCAVGLQAEALLKGCVRLYKLLTQLTRHVYNTWTAPSTRFQKLVDLTGRSLTDFVYAFVNFCQNGDDAEESAARIARQEKIVPALVFSIEQYQKNLIQLSKSSNVNLLRSFKRSVARDFKIKADVLEQQGDEPEVAPTPEVADRPKVPLRLLMLSLTKP